MIKYGVGHAICILLTIGFALTNEYDLALKVNLSDAEQKKPFGNCKIYSLGNSKKTAYNFRPWQDVAELAFYPLTEEDVILGFGIFMQDFNVLVKIEVSMFKLKKCYINGSEKSCILKGNLELHPDMRAHEWNMVRMSVRAGQPPLDVDNMDKPSNALRSSIGVVYWTFSYEAGKSTQTTVKNPDQCLVQFKCKEKQLFSAKLIEMELYVTEISTANDFTAGGFFKIIGISFAGLVISALTMCGIKYKSSATSDQTPSQDQTALI